MERLPNIDPLERGAHTMDTSSGEKPGAVLGKSIPKSNEIKIKQHKMFEINDFPQSVRAILTKKESLEELVRRTKCYITVKGMHQTGSQKDNSKEHALHLFIESDSKVDLSRSTIIIEEFVEQKCGKAVVDVIRKLSSFTAFSNSASWHTSSSSTSTMESEHVIVDMNCDVDFHLTHMLLGRNNEYIKHLELNGCTVELIGRGTGQYECEPLQFVIKHPNKSYVKTSVSLAQNLIETVRKYYDSWKAERLIEHTTPPWVTNPPENVFKNVCVTSSITVSTTRSSHGLGSSAVLHAIPHNPASSGSTAAVYSSQHLVSRVKLYSPADSTQNEPPPTSSAAEVLLVHQPSQEIIALKPAPSNKSSTQVIVATPDTHVSASPARLITSAPRSAELIIANSSEPSQTQTQNVLLIEDPQPSTKTHLFMPQSSTATVGSGTLTLLHRPGTVNVTPTSLAMPVPVTAVVPVSAVAAPGYVDASGGWPSDAQPVYSLSSAPSAVSYSAPSAMQMSTSGGYPVCVSMSSTAHPPPPPPPPHLMSQPPQLMSHPPPPCSESMAPPHQMQGLPGKRKMPDQTGPPAHHVGPIHMQFQKRYRQGPDQI